MEKFIPYEKLSKTEKRKMDLAKRQTWGELNPVTRKPENSKAYNRKKSQNWKRELPPTDLRLFLFFGVLILLTKSEFSSEICYLFFKYFAISSTSSGCHASELITPLCHIENLAPKSVVPHPLP